MRVLLCAMSVMYSNDNIYLSVNVAHVLLMVIV